MTDYVALGFVPFERVLEEARNGVDSLILVSGGLDSAYCLYKYAEAAKGRTVNVHHVKLYPTLRKRHIVENHCVAKQLAYINADICRIDSTVDICTTFNILPMRDFFMAVVMSISYAMKNKLRYIVVGDDIIDGFVRGSSFGRSPDQRNEEELQGLKTFVDKLSHGEVELSLSMQNSDVYSEYMSLPDDYLQLCFSCRNPEIKDTHFHICNDCPACNRNTMLGIREKLCRHMRLDR